MTNGEPTRYERDIQDYLDATGESAKRTRNVILVLVIATVLVFSGLLNSQQTNWMHKRLDKLRDIHSDYVASKVGAYPIPSDYKDDPAAYKLATEAYEHRYLDLWAAVARTYVDNSWVIRVPFFGFSFDVNDLGLLGGFGLLTILVCLRFCLSRELNNLRLSFDVAKQASILELQEFYTLLAMRQVFTVPKTTYITRSKFLKITPKLIVWLTVAVYFAVTFNDATTGWVSRELAADYRYRFVISFEGVVLVLLCILSAGVTQRLIRMDRVWDDCWNEINIPAVATRKELSPVLPATMPAPPPV
jgi:hypothetical protein